MSVLLFLGTLTPAAQAAVSGSGSSLSGPSIASPSTPDIIFERAIYDGTGNTTPSSSKIMRLSPGTPDGTLSTIADGSGPSISPDGTQIAYTDTAMVNGELEPVLMVMNSDGSSKRQLVASLCGLGHPEWSPNGAQIVYVYRFCSSATFIYRVNVDGSDNLDGSGGTALTSFSTNDGGADSGPAWSPDGNRIVYLNGSNGIRTFIMNADGSSRHLLSSSLDGQLDGYPFGFASWSPGGTRIYLTNNYTAGTGPGIFYYTSTDNFTTPDATTRQLLTSSVFPDGVNVSGDGKLFTYSDCDGCVDTGARIWTIGSSGGTPTQVTNEMGALINDYYPSFVNGLAGTTPPTLTLTPAAGSESAGATRTITAQLLDGVTATAIAGTQIRFVITSGPDAGALGSCVPTTCLTGSNGRVSFTYRNDGKSGTDVVTASASEAAGSVTASASVTWVAPNRYVALGDSYSSGEGAIDTSGHPAFIPGTNTSKDKCHRSAHAYAYQLKATANFSGSNFTFAACSGAEIADFTTKVGLSGQWTEGPQLNALAAPGKSSSSTALVTLSLGGNDAGFAQILDKCVDGPGHSNSQQTCLMNANTTSAKGFKLLSNGGYIVFHPKDGTWVFCTGSCLKWGPKLSPSSGYIAVKVPSLSGLYGMIHDRAPNSKIRILLYPHLFASKPPATCTVGTFTSIAGVVQKYHLTKTEMLALNGLADKLNDTISAQVNVARLAGVDVKAVNPNIGVGPVPGFGGHGLCDAMPSWINGVLWGATLLQRSPYSFHPTAIGQADFASIMEIGL